MWAGMTAPKRWPNQAAWARDDAALLSQEAIRVLRPLLAHKDLQVVAAVGRAIDYQQRAVRFLIQVGAPIREDQL